MEEDEEYPFSLQKICLEYCLQHLESFCDYDESSELYEIRKGVTLPAGLSDSLLKVAIQKRIPLRDEFLHIFNSQSQLRLKHLRLQDTEVTDTGLSWLMAHKPVELDISGCANLSKNCLKDINLHGKKLYKLFIGDAVTILADVDLKDPLVDTGGTARERIEAEGWEFGRDYIFDCPHVRAFSVHGLNEYPAHDIIATILNPFIQLTYLDLSSCEIELEFMDCLEEIRGLMTLILYDVPINNIYGAFRIIGRLKNLRALDLGQSKEQPVMYSEPEENLQRLVSCLPHLNSLDISGTNLAGFEKKEPVNHKLSAMTSEDEASKTKNCSIPGLDGRHFEFLGLLHCAYEACYRENIPATKVTGDCTEEQVILSVRMYSDKPDLLLRSLNNLFQIFRYSTCKNEMLALNVILIAMNKHPYDKLIQISGSASLFYIVRGSEKEHFSQKYNRRIISTILTGMENHLDESTMMRNSCLTLCHFRIPGDVMFEYQRMVKVLLKMVATLECEEFVQRIGIYLINSLACQVDGTEKRVVGNLGAISVMLEIIEERLTGNICDEVMEISWSAMWNVTDETPVNCEKFIDGKGMEIFLRCLNNFPKKPELLRNMMGLMGNIAEVDYLRRKLMKPEYIRVFSDLLESESDGIEVSYNACGVLSHIMSDGTVAWTVHEPSRQHVQQCMTDAINKWNIRTNRNINYRSFEPILRLIHVNQTEQSQHWAIWALCNLTTMYPKKYCDLLNKEGGLDMISEVVGFGNCSPVVAELGNRVLDLCRRYFLNPELVENPEDDEVQA